MIMTGKTIRLINFLVDSGAFFIFLILFMMLFRNIIPVENMKGIAVVLYFLYYFLFEYITGRTLGKMITKTRVVSLTINHNNFFIRLIFRTLMRMIPIDILSYLFSARGLHDRITMTALIGRDEKMIL